MQEHETTTGVDTTTSKFPDFESSEGLERIPEENAGGNVSRMPSPQMFSNRLPPGLHSSQRWPLRKEGAYVSSWTAWANKNGRGSRRARQKSLSEAIRTVRTRSASISENAHEIASSLKAPVSFKLVSLCAVWYATSILSNTSSKAILTAFPKPITLTVMQFFLVSSWCVALPWIAKRNLRLRRALPILKSGIRKPNLEIIKTTLPLTAFQIFGHMLSSDATSRIPVSLVHTIKGLSPLMTVFAYHTFFDIRYSTPTYLSLIPLTLGVVMACSASFKGNTLGLTSAFGSAIIFVAQNIVSKKLFTESAQAEMDGTPARRRKPDKLNLLCYSSGLAFLFTLPIWLWSEGFSLAADFLQDGSVDLRQKPGSLDHGALALEFLFNGTFQFAQSLVAFVLLGLTSPVSYSVASLIKRVAVILFAIVWFGNPMTRIQGLGFVLTFLGLYLYDRTSDATRTDRRARAKAAASTPLLPLNVGDNKREPSVPQPPADSVQDLARAFMGGSSYSNGAAVGSGPGRPDHGSYGDAGVPISLPPGTKAAETWTRQDVAVR